MIDRRRGAAVRELRALKLISACNTILLAGGAESQLMNNMCQALAEIGGYRLVAVHYAQDDAAKSVIPISTAGVGTDYLVNSKITWGDGERGRGPTGTAIRTGKTAVNRDFIDTPEMAPWRAAAQEHGLRSSMAVPIRIGEEIIGALTLYSMFSNAFTKPEIALVEQVTGDFAFGIAALRGRLSELKARADAAGRAAMIESILAAAPAGVILSGPNLEIVAFNPQYAQVWKIRPEAITGKSEQELAAFLAQRTLEPAAYRDIITKSALSREHRIDNHLIALADGRTIDRFSTPAYTKDGDFMGRATFVVDVTEARRRELQFRRINRVLMIVALLLFAGVVGLLLRPYFSLANVFSVDGASPIRLRDRLGPPYSAVGMVESVNPVTLSADQPSAALARGTGFMVSPCYAMTAYHVPFGIQRFPSPDQQPDAAISLGEKGAGFLYLRLPAKVVRWGDFLHDRRQDWVLMRVDGCPGRDSRLGWLRLATAADAYLGRGAAATAGYDVAYAATQLVGQNDCYLGHPAAHSFTLPHYCAARAGLSGAPIYVRSPEGTQVVAIDTAEQQPTATVLKVALFTSRPNTATYVPEVLAQSDVAALIANDIAENRGAMQPQLSSQ
jgi:PAS domain-containing protein